MRLIEWLKGFMPVTRREMHRQLARMVDMQQRGILSL